MKKTKLTFYGGVNEIGGNKILLEDGDTRVFLISACHSLVNLSTFQIF